jgi:hypothetical protein
MPHGRMIDQAINLGFVYSRRGCPCNGTPRIYRAVVQKSVYTLTIWEKKNAWKLAGSGGHIIASGNKDNLTTKIQEIWDYSKN